MIETITAPDGRRRVMMDEEEYLDLIDARDAAVALREIAAGAPTFSEAEADAYLAAATPLAFWRQRAGLTQKALADKADVSQAFVAQIESGRRHGTVTVLADLAKALGVRVDDLIRV